MSQRTFSTSTNAKSVVHYVLVEVNCSFPMLCDTIRLISWILWQD